MFRGNNREKRGAKPTRKKSLADLKDKEHKEVLKEYKNQNFNQEKTSKEISVIHPVDEKLDAKKKLS